MCGLVLGERHGGDERSSWWKNIESLEARMGRGGEPRAEMAEIQAAPIVTIRLVRRAVFVPVRHPGVTGRLYNQFAMTIRISSSFGVQLETFTPATPAAPPAKQGRRSSAVPLVQRD